MSLEEMNAFVLNPIDTLKSYDYNENMFGYLKDSAQCNKVVTI